MPSMWCRAVFFIGRVEYIFILMCIPIYGQLWITDTAQPMEEPAFI